jgi:hypothetical protein
LSSFSRGPREAGFAGWHHPKPELGALGLLDPQAKDLFTAAGADAERQVDRLVADRALVADLHPQGVEDDQRVDRLERAILPLGDVLEDGVGHRAHQLGRDVETVDLGQVTLDLADRQAAGVHRDDLVVEARQPAPVFGDELRIEGREPIPRYRDRQLAGRRHQRLAAVAVAAIVATFHRLCGQVVVHLGVQGPLGEGALQLVENAAFGQRRAGITSRQQLVH